MATYRTRTYIAGDWTGDKDLIEQLYKWNESDYWALHFIDAHELMQARDSSLSCTIKRSLAERLNASKTFVLVVGAETKTLTKGSCRYCESYDSWPQKCKRGYCVDYRSYIKYECEKAFRDDLRIVVIYNYASVRREKCPDVLQYVGKHVNAYYNDNGVYRWNYQGIKDAIMANS